jgi:integrase
MTVAPTSANALAMAKPRPRDAPHQFVDVKIAGRNSGPFVALDQSGARDSTMILIGFRHALRASELCELQWSDVEFESATLHIRRARIIA